VTTPAPGPGRDFPPGPAPGSRGGAPVPREGPLRLLVANWQDRENPRAGGAEIHLHAVFGRLAARGHQVTLVTSGWEGAPARTTLDGMEVIRTGGRHSYLLTAPPLLRRLLRDHPPHLLVEDLNKVPLFAPLWSPVPVLLLVHHLFGRVAFQEASFPLALATWLLERPIPRVYRGTPTVAVSRSTATDLEVRGLPPRRITVIPNGIEVGELTSATPGGRFAEPTLLYLGRLQRYKRVDLILQALARLRDEGVGARLLVGGKGEHRGELEALSQRLGIGDRVRFLGFVSEAEKLELFRRSWVHVLTSPKEGWGISAMEAAGCGTPTVASDSPGLRDSVRDGETGVLVPHGDVPALAAALSRLLGDAGLREEMGRRAVTWAGEHDWDSIAERWETLLLRGVPTWPTGPGER
jgi:glycosyltransferase involved in cell wall biosynthesis